MCVCVRHVCACVCVGVCVCVGLYIYMFLSPGFNCVPFSAINDMIMKSFSFDSNKPPSKQPLAAKKFWRLFTQSPYGPFSQVLVFATHMSTIDPPLKIPSMYASLAQEAHGGHVQAAQRQMQRSTHGHAHPHTPHRTKYTRFYTHIHTRTEVK